MTVGNTSELSFFCLHFFSEPEGQRFGVSFCFVFFFRRVFVNKQFSQLAFVRACAWGQRGKQDLISEFKDCIMGKIILMFRSDKTTNKTK